MPPNTSIDKWRFELPSDHDPDDDWCIVVKIPGHADYLKALVGHLRALTFSQNFERDDSKTGAAEVSRRWEKALYSQPIIRMDCDPLMDVRQNSTAPCTLEKTFDNGETWETWANLQLCPPQVIVAPDGTMHWWNPTGIPGGPVGGHDGTGAWEPLPYDVSAISTELVPAGPVPYPPGTPEYEDCSGRGIVAANIAATLQGDAQKIRDGVTGPAMAVVLIVAVLATLTLLVGAPEILVSIAIALAGYWGVLSDTTVEGLYDDIDWYIVRDAIYCQLDCSGAMTEGGKLSIAYALEATYPDNALMTVLIWILRSIPAAQLNNVARIHNDSIPPATGSEYCRWIKNFTPGNGLELWEQYPGIYAGTPGTLGSLGWEDGVYQIPENNYYRGVLIQRPMPVGTLVTDFVVDYVYTKGNPTIGANTALNIGDNTGALITRSFDAMADGSNHEVWHGSRLMSNAYVHVPSSYRFDSGVTGDVLVVAITLAGVGDEPDWS